MTTTLELTDFYIDATEDLEDGPWYGIVCDRDLIEVYKTEICLSRSEALLYAENWVKEKLAWDYTLSTQLAYDGTLTKLTGLKDIDNLNLVADQLYDYCANEFTENYWRSPVEAWKSFVESGSYEPIYEVGMIVKWDSYNFEATGQIEFIRDGSYHLGKKNDTIVGVKPLPSFQYGYCLTPAIDQDTVELCDRYITGVVLEPLTTNFNQLSIFNITENTMTLPSEQDSTAIAQTENWDAVDNGWDYIPTEVVTESDVTESLESLLEDAGASDLMPVKTESEIEVSTEPSKQDIVSFIDSQWFIPHMHEQVLAPDVTVSQSRIVITPVSGGSDNRYSAKIELKGKINSSKFKMINNDYIVVYPVDNGVEVKYRYKLDKELKAFFTTQEFKKFTDRLPIIVSRGIGCQVEKSVATEAETLIGRESVNKRFYGIKPTALKSESIDTAIASQEDTKNTVDKNTQSASKILVELLPRPITGEVNISDAAIILSSGNSETPYFVNIRLLGCFGRMKKSISLELRRYSSGSLGTVAHSTSGKANNIEFDPSEFRSFSDHLPVVVAPYFTCSIDKCQPATDEQVAIARRLVLEKYYGLNPDHPENQAQSTIDAIEPANESSAIDTTTQAEALTLVDQSVEMQPKSIETTTEVTSVNEVGVIRYQGDAKAIAASIVDRLKSLTSEPTDKTRSTEDTTQTNQVISWHRINTKAIAQALSNSDSVERLYKAVAASDPDLAQALFIEESLEIAPTPVPSASTSKEQCSASDATAMYALTIDAIAVKESDSKPNQPESTVVTHPDSNKRNSKSVQTKQSKEPKQPNQPKKVKATDQALCAAFLLEETSSRVGTSDRSISPHEKLKELENLKGSVDARGKKVVAEELGYSDTSTINASLIGHSVLTGSSEVMQWFLDGQLTWSHIRESRRQINKIGLTGVVEQLRAIATK